MYLYLSHIDLSYVYFTKNMLYYLGTVFTVNERTAFNGGGYAMLILGLNKTTLLDYPGHVAATLFTGGCNFRCPYCHNSDIVLKNESIVPLTPEEVLAFLKKRQNVLTGVCITGGEPTLHTDLPYFIGQIRALGYLVKLDTNGTNPQMLQNLIETGLVNCCAMDIKNAPEKYGMTAGFDGNPARFDLSAVDESIKILMRQNRISYEFRTTVVKELHNESDMLAISQWIAGAETYFLQSYADSAGVLCEGYHAHPEETLQKYVSICRRLIPNTVLRGV